MKRQLALALTCAFLAVTALPATASNGDIKAFFVLDTGNQGTGPTRLCDFWQLKYRGNSNVNFRSCPQTLRLRIYAVLNGASANGITGVEFRALIGANSLADPGWLLFELPNPEANARLGAAFNPPDDSGTPIVPRGLVQSWPSCQTGTDGLVLIEEVIALRTTPDCGPDMTPPTQTFVVGAYGQKGCDVLTPDCTPPNQFFRCPLFVLCDDPAFTKVCLGDNVITGSGTVGVPPTCRQQVPPFPNNSKCSTTGNVLTINPPPDPVTGHVKDVGDCVKLNKSGGTYGVATDRTWAQVKGLYR